MPMPLAMTKKRTTIPKALAKVLATKAGSRFGNGSVMGGVTTVVAPGGPAGPIGPCGPAGPAGPVAPVVNCSSVVVTKMTLPLGQFLPAATGTLQLETYVVVAMLVFVA